MKLFPLAIAFNEGKQVLLEIAIFYYAYIIFITKIQLYKPIGDSALHKLICMHFSFKHSIVISFITVLCTVSVYFLMENCNIQN